MIKSQFFASISIPGRKDLEKLASRVKDALTHCLFLRMEEEFFRPILKFLRLMRIYGRSFRQSSNLSLRKHTQN